MNKDVKLAVGLFCGVILFGVLASSGEDRVVGLAVIGVCLVVCWLMKKMWGFLKKASASATQSNKSKYPEELKKQVEQDADAEYTAKLQDFDKYNELKNNKKRR